MKNRKSFLKGALCGALAMLLAAGLLSCGLKVNSGSSDITSKTEDKISELQNLVKKHYMGDVKEKNLEDGIYKGYINGLNDPYSVYYNKKETKELYERIQARIKRYYAIEKGILASNASNIISTQIGDMTITGAISLRNRLRGKGAYRRTGLFEKNLEEEMEQELARYEKRCANQNELLSDRAAEMRLSILGKDNKGKQDQFLDVVEAFLKENTVELVDPLHIKKCSEANAARRDELLTELDTKIKVSNATVFVEIEE